MRFFLVGLFAIAAALPVEAVASCFGCNARLCVGDRAAWGVARATVLAPVQGVQRARIESVVGPIADDVAAGTEVWLPLDVEEGPALLVLDDEDAFAGLAVVDAFEITEAGRLHCGTREVDLAAVEAAIPTPECVDRLEAMGFEAACNDVVAEVVGCSAASGPPALAGVFAVVAARLLRRRRRARALPAGMRRG